MSAGPISQERAAHRPPAVSTKPGSSTHLASGLTDSGVLCGRRVSPSSVVPSAATCADCAAAQRADLQAQKEARP